MLSRSISASLYGLLCAAASCALSQDIRSIQEPVFPATCKVYHAPLHSRANEPIVAPSVEEQDKESDAETRELQKDLDGCGAGQGVELVLGSDNTNNSFLINPILVPAGVSLIIDGGVTVFGSRNPEKYQIDPSHNSIVCGTYGSYPVEGGCRPLITLKSNGGVYGYGVVDGQGNRLLLAGPKANKLSWWDLITQKGKTGKRESSPNVISDGSSGGCKNLTLYKVTIRNPPWHTVSLGGEGLTIWGVKVQAPWNVPNTDGFDIHGSNVMVYDTTVANGDQEIAIVTGNTRTERITIDHFNGYNKGGIALLGSGDAISDVLIQHVNITGDLPSVVGTTVNGRSFDELKPLYHLNSYDQELPNATNDLHALQITTNINSKTGADISGVTFKAICIQDIQTPINIGPVRPFTPTDSLPTVTDILFQDVHVLAPTLQFPSSVIKHKPKPEGSLGSYELAFVGYPHPGGNEFFNQVTFDNVVFDRFPVKVNDPDSGKASLSLVEAVGNTLTTKTNVYPFLLNSLAADYTVKPVRKMYGDTEVRLSANSYVSQTSTSRRSLAHSCPSQLPFVIGDLFISRGNEPATGILTNRQYVEVREGEPIELNAVVQPIMSQTTHFVHHAYGAEPGLLAVGSPALTNSIVFYEGDREVGQARLSANGTLATLVLRDVKPGAHLYTARYPADSYYAALDFGRVAVEVKCSYASR